MTDAVPMPEVAPPAWENIPPELAAEQHWLLWKFEEPLPNAKTKKWRKVPYYVTGGRRSGDQGSVRDRSRLASLRLVRELFDKGGWHGIGFAFLPDDGFIGIDIDDAIDADGVVSQRCLDIVQACGSFTEFSPSGRGCHIFVRGKTESAKSNDIGLEMFCGSQFFTVTARLWPESLRAVVEIDPKVIGRLHATIAEAKERRRASLAASLKPVQPAQPGGRGAHPEETVDQLRERVESALGAMSPDMEYGDWISIGWALRDAFGDSAFALWDSWSSRGGTYPGEAKLQAHWKSFKSTGKPMDDIVGVIFARARDAGWKPPSRRAGRTSGRDGTRAKVGAPAGGGSGGAPPGGDDGPPPPDDDDGTPSIRLLKGKGGKPEDCRENVLYCLRNDPALAGLVALNQFTEGQDKTRSPPWGGEAGEWSEEDDLMLGEYLARTHKLLLKGVGTIRAGVQMAARENKHHPIIERLRAVEWDGIERMETWMVDCLGAVDRPYVRMISRFFIMGMVARVIRPGCKFDYMVIFQGLQGLGKSTAFKALAAPYFMDTPFRIGDKDSYLSLQGVWLVEFSELENMSRAESTAIKAFVSSTEDRFRPPYGHRMVKMPRRAVLCGTTNSDQFLKDSTGDRRMWPVQCTEPRPDLLEACRDQLFAEALHVLENKAGTDAARYYPTREEEKQYFHPEQDRWRMVDVWTDIIGDYLTREYTGNIDDPNEIPPAKRGFFTAQELFAKALFIKAERMDNAKLMQVRVSNAMRELGYVACREPTGARKRGYLRPGWEFADKGLLRRIPVKAAVPQGQDEASESPPSPPAGGDDALPI
jgi:putative DNA primase/helicase